MGDILNSVEKPTEERVLEAYDKAEKHHKTITIVLCKLV